MNYRIILSYVLVIAFFACLIFAYIKYTTFHTEGETNKIRQNIVTAVEKELSDIKEEIILLKKPHHTNNTNFKEEQLKKFIIDNAEFIIKTLDDFKQQKAIEVNKTAIQNNVKEIFDDVTNGKIKTFTGNISAPIKVIEFFDYSCGYCANMSVINNNILNKNSDVMMIFIELPMLGNESIEMARISTAVSIIAPDKYFAFQNALLNMKVARTHDAIISLAGNTGIDKEKLDAHLADEKNITEIDTRVKKNAMLANQMQLKGIPTYIIGDEVFVGATEQNKLEEAIAQLRK